VYHFDAGGGCARDAAVGGAEINSPGCCFHQDPRQATMLRKLEEAAAAITIPGRRSVPSARL
jgi:hypothetical protein